MTAVMAGCTSGGSTSGGTDETDALTITTTVPADAATDVALNSNVVATFSEAMDDTTITTDSFTVKGLNETALIGTIVYDTASNSASFAPDRALTASTFYTATVKTTVQSVSGKVLAVDFIWSFTTGTTADTTPPTVLTTDPADADVNIPLNRNVTANFSETLEPSTVNSDTFTLKNGATVVPGAISYASKVAIFNPTDNLAPNTVYTATLTTGIQDVAGNAMAAEFVWSFETGDVTTIAKGPAPVNLRTAGDFVILTKTGITNVPTSSITGNIGASPITAAAMDNVFCSEITGFIYGANAAYTGSGDVSCFKGEAADNTLVANAVLDMGTAYTDAAGRATPDFTELYAGDISGQTLVPGLYKWGTNVLINTDVTLDGGPNDVWIFQVGQNIVQASDKHVLLAGGALAKNVFWQVSGGVGVTLDTGATFQGVILAEKAIIIKTGATINGRLLSQTEVTLQQNIVTQPAE